MAADRWRRVEELVHGALERPAAERPAWLAEACGGDPALLEEVRSLLALEDRAREFLETPALARDPQWIEDYRILRRLAAGGSAIVFAARKGDAGPTVALKVLRGGLFVEPHHRRQFRREVRTLARLEHPCIARFIEAGTTGEGEVFLAMELVEGLPIDAHARELRPPLEQLLETFCSLCEAVDHAHREGVVHRDLKPANVLVEAGGRPRVLDFGLALLLPGGVRTSTIVLRGDVVGTLPYMSPEQARGRPEEVGLRTDVYALGVILYQLLTDSLPVPLAGLGPHEALAAIGELEPRRPSLVRPGLDRALERIALQAIAKRPDERYASAAALGADVRRHLEGRPVLARGPGPLKRLRDLAAAHRLASGLVASAFLALAVFGATVWIKNRELVRERGLAREAEQRARVEAERASEAAARAESTLDIVQSALAEVAQGSRDGADVSVLALFEAVESNIEDLLEDEPELAAELRGTVGRAYQSLGRFELAAGQYREQLRLAAARGAGDTAATRAALGLTLFDSGDYEGAVVALEEALVERPVSGPEAVEQAGLRVLIGRALVRLDRREQAREHFAAAERLLLVADAGAQPSAEALTVLAEIRSQQGVLDEAERALRAALESAPEDGFGEEPGNELAGEPDAVAGRDPDALESALALSQLGYVLVRQERYDEALEQFERGLALCEQEFGPSHPETVSARQNLATLLVELGRYERADELLAGVAASLRALGLEDHEDYASTLAARGAACSHLGRLEESEQHFRAALEAYRGSSSKRRDFLANHLGNLAQALLELGRLDEAEALTLEALGVRREAFGERHPAPAKSLAQLGDIAAARGALDQAEARYREALEQARAGLPPGHLQVGEVENSLAAVLESTGAPDEAEPLYRSSLAAYEAALGTDHPSTRLRSANLGRVLAELERFDEAEPLLSAALEAHAAAGTEGTAEAAELEEALARALLALDRHEQAVPLLEHAAAVLAAAQPVDEALLGRVLATHGRAVLELGEPARAAELLEQALERAPAPPDDPLATAEPRRLLAKARLALGQGAAAEALLAELVDEALAAAGADDPRTVRARQDLERVRGIRAEEAAAPREADQVRAP